MKTILTTIALLFGLIPAVIILILYRAAKICVIIEELKNETHENY